MLRALIAAVLTAAALVAGAGAAHAQEVPDIVCETAIPPVEEGIAVVSNLVCS
ncbi:hypothetical protein A8924_3099 [Saccharopolyspora erythraea NRRL 2338]|uniref:Uncharacterized protein n=2 Tax=Saccharopolyspora erythraea TaxID=1836 RepID=A4FD65_SACEN|nr:hypothetical protein [Saccharopolyspora erythraea]EQD86258.1 hypothetical protein N599_10495 [Saccharopolyspora erythraea D]PFG95737.1 hypothetical protein A8924_3099 [Saccharopolyspora erythraea NRRL 2338]QRK92333.1 hypothetical protein JQX30_14015 [Saccharopolyspora erythraea]CAM01990.1 hypothetical protein SACE_2709 [Saccharopolyspora erythraea NRRL 2338]